MSLYGALRLVKVVVWLVLLLPTSAFAHSGLGREPSLTVVHEVIGEELRSSYLFPREMFLRVFEGRDPAGLEPQEALRWLDERTGVWADGKRLQPRLRSAWYSGPAARTARASRTSTIAGMVGFARQEAPWSLVQIQTSVPLPDHIETLRLRFALPETYIEHADEPELRHVMNQHVFSLLIGEKRHPLSFSPTTTERDLDWRRLNGDEPRFARVLLAVGLLVTAFLFYRLRRSARTNRPPREAPGPR